MQTISSIKDEKIVLARAVKTRKGRNEYQRMLLEGEQILDWAIEHHVDIEYVLIAGSVEKEAADKYVSRGLQVYQVSAGVLKKVTDTRYLIPIVGVGKIPERDELSTANFVLVLDDVKDHGNIGTIIRTCQAFGVNKVISTTQDFCLYQRKTIEASRGTVFSTLVEKYPSSSDVIAKLQEKDYQIVVTSPSGHRLQSLIELEQKPIALIVGNESQGVSQEFVDEADYVIQIPMSQSIESLNVGVATGISMYELKLKHILVMLEKQIRATLGRELNVAGMLVQKALDAEFLKVSNLGSQHVIFMMVLKCDKQMSLDEMRRQFGILTTETDDFLEPLLDDELVTLNDKLELTSKGEQVLAKLWPTVENTERKILAGFSDAEICVFMKQLRKVQDNCVQMMSSD